MDPKPKRPPNVKRFVDMEGEIEIVSKGKDLPKPPAKPQTGTDGKSKR